MRTVSTRMRPLDKAKKVAKALINSTDVTPQDLPAEVIKQAEDTLTKIQASDLSVADKKKAIHERLVQPLKPMVASALVGKVKARITQEGSGLKLAGQGLTLAGQ